jgi:hypothetical protein
LGDFLTISSGHPAKEGKGKIDEAGKKRKTKHKNNFVAELVHEGVHRHLKIRSLKVKTNGEKVPHFI